MVENGRRWRPAQWVSAVMTGFSALVTPTLVSAQQAAGDASPAADGVPAATETSVAILGTFIVAVLALIGMAWLRRRWSREQLRASHFLAMTARLEAALAATPVPYAGWLSTGQPIASQSFLERLGMDELLAFEGVLERFAAADRPRLAGAMEQLRGAGRPFDLTVSDRDGASLTLAGRRGRSSYPLPDGDPAVFDMLWLVSG